MQRALPTLNHPTINNCTSTEAKQGAAVSYYYENLFYTADPVDSAAIRSFTNHIPPANRSILDSEHQASCTPFSLDDLLEASARAPKQSSPGIDSLPYAIIHLMLSHPATTVIALRVYSDALLEGGFAPSWQGLYPPLKRPTHVSFW